MVIVRTLVLLLLFVAAVFFALYAATGRPHYKRYGMALFKWTLIAAAVFFGVLIVQRI